MLRRALEKRAIPYPLIGVVAALLALALAVRLATMGVPAPLPAPRVPPVPPPVPRVGIQAGHWLTYDVPDELSALSTASGAMGGDWDEFLVNYQVAQKVTDILVREGIEVDLLPTTVPEGYRANLFLALHGDASDDHRLTGFKVARAEWSQHPAVDDALVQDLIRDYQAATGLPENRNTITDNMTEYYAFNYAKYRHAISPSTPAAILEMGFLTNDGDRELLTRRQEVAARGIAKAVLDFLGRPSRTGL